LKHFVHLKSANPCDWKPESAEHLKAKVAIMVESDPLASLYSQNIRPPIRFGKFGDGIPSLLPASPCCGQEGFLRTSNRGLKHFVHLKSANPCDWKPESAEHLPLNLESDPLASLYSQNIRPPIRFGKFGDGIPSLLKARLKAKEIVLTLPCCGQEGFLRTSNRGLKHFVHLKSVRSMETISLSSI